MSQVTEVKQTKPWYKKKRFVIPLGLLVVLFAISTLSGTGDGADSKSGSTSSESISKGAVEKTDKKAAPKEKKLTRSQENAVRSAESYLDFSPFSKSGLVKQLKFEKYSEKDAKFAVNHVKVNWNEQAVKAAKGYLDVSPFSKGGLIQQLEFEGYTSSQAEYGVSKSGL